MIERYCCTGRRVANTHSSLDEGYNIIDRRRGMMQPLGIVYDVDDAVRIVDALNAIEKGLLKDPLTVRSTSVYAVWC